METFTWDKVCSIGNKKPKLEMKKKSLVYLEVHMKPPSFRLAMEKKPCFLFVPSSSQNVPIRFPKSPRANVFLKMFPITPHFNHILFGLGTKGKHDRTCLYFGEGSLFRLPCWGVAHVSKRLVMGQSNGSFRKIYI